MHTYLFFGRCNPPTVAHQKIIREFASKGNLEVYLSKKELDNKNPLPYDWKVSLCEEAFSHPIKKTNARNPLEALTELYNSGYTEVTVVLGEDRIDMRNRIMLYNGSLYHFNEIYFENTGDRKDGISSSALRRELKEASASDILPIELWKYSEEIADWVSESPNLRRDYHMTMTHTAEGKPVWRRTRKKLNADKDQDGSDTLSTADDKPN